MTIRERLAALQASIQATPFLGYEAHADQMGWLIALALRHQPEVLDLPAEAIPEDPCATCDA